MTSPRPVLLRLTRVATAGALALAGLATAAAVSPPNAVQLAAAPSAKNVDLPIRMVQGNLESPQSLAGFRADMKTVMQQHPDLITYNEVAYRSDADLAPSGYSMFRTPGKYTGENVVAWKTSEWNEVATGTWMVSNSTRKTKAQHVQLGMRYASWATLQNVESGVTVSLVSVHTPPKTYPVKNLLRPSIERVGKLVDQLAGSGPVLIGGDFNMHYHGERYAADLLQKYQMVPTFDVTGKAMPTHDAGGIIDYIFGRTTTPYSVQRQWTVNIHSDHKLLVGDLTLSASSGDAATIKPGTIVNNPDPAPGTLTKKIIDVINDTPKGAAIHLASRRLTGLDLMKALLRAHNRGVYVQVISGTKEVTYAEQKLIDAFGSDVSKRTFATNRQSAWTKVNLPEASVLASYSTNTSAVRMNIDRSLSTANQDQPSRAKVTTDKKSYDSVFRRFLAAVGRTL